MGSTYSAPLWRRFAAMIYDLFPVLAISFFTGAISLLITGGTLDVSHPPLWYRFFLLVMIASYFVVSWVRGGQTIGMRAWRLKLVRCDGSPLTVTLALLRFGVALLSLSVFGLGFFWALFDSQHRCWHDLAARTILIKITHVAENKPSPP